MQILQADSLTWKELENGVREAEIFVLSEGGAQTRIDIVEVLSAGYIAPHRHKKRREFITVLHSAGAQIQVGERIFRPTIGQMFEREPGEVMALTNDTTHPFRYSVTRFNFEPADIEQLNAGDKAKDSIEKESKEKVEQESKVEEVAAS